jgi:hypothetical protein
VWIDDKYKLIVNPVGRRAKAAGAPVALYDIFADPAEKVNLADQHPDVVKRMREALEAWQRSVRASYDGKDFVKP